MGRRQYESRRVCTIADHDLVNKVLNPRAIVTNDTDELNSIREQLLDQKRQPGTGTRWAVQNDLGRVCHD